jgi:hypothetical protein
MPINAIKTVSRYSMWYVVKSKNKMRSVIMAMQI